MALPPPTNLIFKMSILNRQDNQPSHQKIAADTIKETAFVINKRLLRVFAEGVNTMWSHPHVSAQQVCDELGTDAKEVFELHSALGQFLEANSPDDISGIKSKIGSYTVNSDGTVTIN